MLVFLYMVNWADKAVLGIIAQPLAQELGLTASQIGLVGSLFFLTFTVGSLFAGTVNKWLSLRWSLAIIALLWSATMLPMILFAGFAVLLVSRLLLGFAEGPSGPLIHTANYSWHAPEKRGVPSAVVSAAAAFAKILLAPALAFITVTFGWRAALLSLALLGVLWCLLWVPTWSDGPFIKSGAHTTTAGTGADEPAVPWIRIFATRTFVTLALVSMSIYLLVAVVLTWLPSYFELGLGYSRLEAGSLLVFPSLAGLIMMFALSVVSDRLTTRGTSSRVSRVLIPGVGVTLSGLLLITLPSWSVPAVAVLVVSIGYGFINMGMPLFLAAVSEICPPRQTAGMLGVYSAILGLGGMIGPYATGLIVDASATPGAGYATAFQVFGGIAAVLAVAAMLLANPERDKAKVRGIHA